MSAIEEKTTLKIKTHDGDIEIPFISLEMLDEFTVRYGNRDELVNSLLAMLNISIDRKILARRDFPSGLWLSMGVF